MDKWFCEKFQDGYLWLLDRTGVYLGTCLFLCILVAEVPDIVIGEHLVFNGILIAWMGFICGFHYYLQEKEHYDKHNAINMSWEASITRRLLTGWTIGTNRN